MKLMYNNQGAYYGRNMGRWLWDAGKPGLDPKEPFYMESRGDAMNVSIRKFGSSAPTIAIEYSFDKTTWQSLGSTSTAAKTINVSGGEKVWLRASTKGWAANSTYYNYITTSSPSNVGGNIMSLLYGDTFTGQIEFPPTATSFIFFSLFRNGSSGVGNIVDASKLLLPATTLAQSCYGYMFSNCTSLTTVPALPATTLAQSCYNYMFWKCTSLTTAPELPATTLVQSCYSYMFTGCTSLTTAPELPAETLVDYCYNSMFSGCTSLTTAPALPATTLANNCYKYMFSGCTSLTTAPALPATTLANSCYSSMFKNCTSLTTAPELPAETLVDYCYNSMFSGCTSLTTAPALPAETLVDYCYNIMFQGCTNLNYIKCLATDTTGNYTYDWVNGVASLGTFVKKAGVSWFTDYSGIPPNWTVVEV